MTFAQAFKQNLGNDVRAARRIRLQRPDLAQKRHVILHAAWCPSQDGHACCCVPTVRVGGEVF